MSKKYLKFIFLSLFLIITLANLLFYVLPGQASTREDLINQMSGAAKSGWGNVVPSGQSSLPGIIQVIISALLSLLGIIFLILIIYAGFNWMMAQGDEEKVTKAKDTLTRAVIGLIIIVMAYAITFFVFSNLPLDEASLTGSP